MCRTASGKICTWYQIIIETITCEIFIGSQALFKTLNRNHSIWLSVRIVIYGLQSVDNSIGSWHYTSLTLVFRNEHSEESLPCSQTIEIEKLQ